MQFKQKLAYMALGGLLVLAGHVLPGLVVPKAAAQGGKKPSAEFDTLTVRSLNVVDAAGRVRARLEVTARGSLKPVEDVMQVFNEAGVAVYRVGVDEDSGNVNVYGNDGMPRATMGGASEGGSEGGGVLVMGSDGEILVGMGVASTGGFVSTYNRAGRETGSLP